MKTTDELKHCTESTIPISAASLCAAAMTFTENSSFALHSMFDSVHTHKKCAIWFTIIKVSFFSRMFAFTNNILCSSFQEFHPVEFSDVSFCSNSRTFNFVYIHKCFIPIHMSENCSYHFSE